MSAWRTIVSQESRILWLSGRAPLLLAIFSLALAILSFLFATNKELSLIPPREVLHLLATSTIAVAILLSLILGADSISGERDRASLESLLLTPAPRREILFGKFLASVTPWPVMLLVLMPFLYQLAPSIDAFLLSALWTLALGTILVAGFAAFGVFVSSRSTTNKVSIGTSLLAFILFMIPTQLPGTAQTGGVGLALKMMNPLESTTHFMEKVIVNNRSPGEMAGFLWAPLVFFAIWSFLLLWQRDPRIDLRGQGS